MTVRKNFDQRLGEILSRRPDVRAALEDIRKQSKLPRALVRLRKAAGMTQRQLADKAGWKQPFLTHVETVNPHAAIPDLATIVRYAGACDAEIGLCIVRRDEGRPALFEVVPLTDDEASSEFLLSLSGNEDSRSGYDQEPEETVKRRIASM